MLSIDPAPGADKCYFLTNLEFKDEVLQQVDVDFR
jgi:hypothetical protein